MSMLKNRCAAAGHPIGLAQGMRYNPVSLRLPFAVQRNQRGSPMRLSGRQVKKVSWADTVDVDQIRRKEPFEPGNFLLDIEQVIYSGRLGCILKIAALDRDAVVLRRVRQLRRAFGRYNKEFMAAIAQSRHEFRGKNFETANVGPEAQ
jgi:hypothetical protein